MRYYVYILHETPIEKPYYCKIGVTHDPLRRLAQLQAGNPRPLRSLDYCRRPDGVFGYPVPSKVHALALEKRLFEGLSREGVTFHGDFDYTRLRSYRREWVMGVHPEELDTILMSEWDAYVDEYGLLDLLTPSAVPDASPAT